MLLPPFARAQRKLSLITILTIVNCYDNIIGQCCSPGQGGSTAVWTHFPSIHLRHEDPTPLYQQIADQISLAVLQRDLLPGEHLPPIRTLATLLQVSPITVTQAYRSLARAGLAGGQTGRGTFVLPLPTATPPPSSEVVTSARLTPLPAARDGDGWESVLAGLPGRAGPARSVALGQAFAKLLGALAPESQRDLIELSGGNPEPSLFSLAHWQEIMAEAGRSLDRESSRPDTARALQYGPALGDPALRTLPLQLSGSDRDRRFE